MAVIARVCQVASVREAVSSMSRAKLMDLVEPSRNRAPARMNSSQPISSQLCKRIRAPSIRARNWKTQETPSGVVASLRIIFTFSV